MCMWYIHRFSVCEIEVMFHLQIRLGEQRVFLKV